MIDDAKVFFAQLNHRGCLCCGFWGFNVPGSAVSRILLPVYTAVDRSRGVARRSKKHVSAIFESLPVVGSSRS